jgi:ABC-type glycerol-3-phosphate transport system substrate-binding protein
MSAGSVRRCLGCMLVFLMLTPGSLARQIEFWTTSHGDGITAMLVKELLPRFERETRIVVTHKSVQMNQDDLARVLVGGGPDVLVTWNGTMFTLVGANALVELTPYLNRWSGRSSFFPYFVQPISTLSEGRSVLLSQYTLPIEIAPFGIGYSKNAFSSAGLDPEAAPRGWDELESIAQKLTLKLSGRTIRQGFDTMWWHPEILATFLQLNGETGLSSDRRTARLNTDRAMETFEYLSRLYQAAYPRVQAELSGVTTPPSGSPMRLADGVTAMAFWSPALSLETRKRCPGTEIGVFAPTHSPGTEPKAPAYTTSSSV